MKWFFVEGHWYNIEHIQMFGWHDHALYIYILGRSVPEMFDDPEAVLYSDLIKQLKKAGRW